MKLKYQKVIDHLLLIFTNESYVEGQKLPTETKLMEDLGVGRNTIRKALFEMENLGIVKSRQGSGTFYVAHEKHEKVGKKVTGGLIGLANFYGLGYIYPDIVKGVEDALHDEGYSLVISSSSIGDARDMSSLKLLLDQDIKGLILDLSRSFPDEVESPVINLIKTVNIPIVTTHWNGSYKNFPTITLDDVSGGYNATKYLIDKGHTKIAMIYNSVKSGADRLEGYKKALNEAGIEIDENYIISYDDRGTPIHDDFGYKCAEELFSRKGVNPTAIFCFNDQTAIEAYQALGKRGLRIPEDVSVLGFDDFKHSQFLNPPLTTFMHPKYDLGHWAARVIIDILHNRNSFYPKSVLFEPKLVERESVRVIK
ncbi:MAG: GntR family transcriptional regulator [Spirochaetales bacterium]|nr:GntR family transcriptional regulator [Spirochaetales bacterium]